ncbi:methyl-accepting chemotaxis protein [Planctellipticum variicoloris]|uniref:methyl-accepting chemotaxis protein n=1 Tax=Planctellipticum variicoloris TaxID=3064265 RepID=UPI0030140360|nr:methyl-accepting chemotaxis protein [Planctomycetaceae bacterium SH412]
MSLNVELLTSTFAALAPHADVWSARFYDELFQRHPHLKPMFAGADLEEQRRKLVQSLVIVIRSLERPEALERLLHDLGGRHVDYGAAETDYPLVGTTLLDVLGEFAGPKVWTDDVAEAWTAAVGAVAAKMLEGAALKTSRQPVLVGAATASSGNTDSLSSDSDDFASDSYSTTSETTLGLSLEEPALPQEKIEMTASTIPAVPQTAPGTDNFYGMVEAAPQAMLYVDGNGVVTYLNRKGHEQVRQLASALGFGPEQLVGGSIERLFTAIPTLRNELQQLSAARSFDASIAGATLNVVLSPVHSADGRRTGVSVSLFDVTTERHETARTAENAQNQSAVNQVLAAVQSAETSEKAAIAALQTVREGFGWAYGSYWAVDPADRTLKFTAESGTVTPEFARVTATASFAEGVGLSGRAWRQRDLVFVEDLAKVTDCVRAPVAQRAGVKSGIAIPIEIDGKVVGTLDFFATTTLSLSDERRETLRNVGRLVSQSMTRLRDQTEQARINSMVENMPINVLLANRDFELVYMNPSSRRTLKRLEHLLPRPVDQLIGQKIDIFHKNPEMQRKLLGDPRNLPHNARIQLADEWLDLSVSAISDNTGKYLGPMVSWEIITEKVKMEAEVSRIQNMMDQLPINVMLANRDLELVYINPCSIATLKKIEHLLPRPVNQLLGQKIDIFHKNPEMQRKLLADPRNLPHKARIQLGEEFLDLSISAITDKSGTYVGPMVAWSVVTGQVKLANDFERDVKAVVEIVTSSATEMQASSKSMAAASEETARQSQVVAAASEEATRNVETVSSAAEELSKSIAEIARHVQEASKMTANAVSEADRTNVTIRQLGDSSNEIGHVVKVITSIAQQTNLLALNATIEAARAGEAGKGFAVVANEVKELARQTAKATEEISQKINAIQGATSTAVTAIGSIGDNIRKINEISTTIASAVEEQTAATNEISRNVAEAARGTAEVSSNIAGVSQAADEGGRGASDILAASEGLAQESTRLDSVATDFLKRMRAL